MDSLALRRQRLVDGRILAGADVAVLRRLPGRLFPGGSPPDGSAAGGGNARVHSSDVFYTKESWQDIHARTKCDCVEMEAFALFHNANVLGKNAACLLTISDSFVNKRELTSDERQNSFKNMMTVALEAAIRLYQK